MIRTVPADLSPEAVAEVDATLAAIRREHGVHIPWAIESGSRAWGFPSPDSDYDCRFVYVRPAEQLLTIWPRRDVIETPIRGLMDVNGWDMAKALRLILKGNAVVIEWLQSPIVYAGLPWFRDGMLDFAEQWADRGRIASHYLHLARRQRAVHLDGQAEVPLKKVFYAVRPAAALRWLRLHPDKMLAPMDFSTLMAESDVPAAVTEEVEDLLAQKATSREMGTGQMPGMLTAFMDAELAIASENDAQNRAMPEAAVAAADELFKSVTQRLGNRIEP